MQLNNISDVNDGERPKSPRNTIKSRSGELEHQQQQQQYQTSFSVANEESTTHTHTVAAAALSISPHTQKSSCPLIGATSMPRSKREREDDWKRERKEGDEGETGEGREREDQTKRRKNAGLARSKGSQTTSNFEPDWARGQPDQDIEDGIKRGELFIKLELPTSARLLFIFHGFLHQKDEKEEACILPSAVMLLS